jgi:hypothetical protein
MRYFLLLVYERDTISGNVYENLKRSSGRDMLMPTDMTGLCHNEQGNRVCLCKHRLATD